MGSQRMNAPFLAFGLVPVPPSMLMPTSNCLGPGSQSRAKGEQSGTRLRWLAEARDLGSSHASVPPQVP